jgi:hypothetical protein
VSSPAYAPPVTSFLTCRTVCDWWHGVPQLFFRIKYYSKTAYPAPRSCADVDLVPKYI